MTGVCGAAVCCGFHLKDLVQKPGFLSLLAASPVLTVGAAKLREACQALKSPGQPNRAPLFQYIGICSPHAADAQTHLRALPWDQSPVLTLGWKKFTGLLSEIEVHVVDIGVRNFLDRCWVDERSWMMRSSRG